MRAQEPFQREDLECLDELLAKATAVVSMQEIHDGALDRRIIGLRHDVDNYIQPAVAMAAWERERGYRSTYFILHTAPYWNDKRLLVESLELIADCGHEIGFHLNAIAAAIQTRNDPVEIAEEAVEELRSYGYPVRGVVAHGDNLCHKHRFVNDELFLESRRPEYGDATRTIAGVPLDPISRAELGFDYDANWLTRADYISDSGGSWSQPFDDVCRRFPPDGQLHMLIHADWWTEAFLPEQVAA
jgi:hypothetical protein